jgi:hypothetical protein
VSGERIPTPGDIAAARSVPAPPAGDEATDGDPRVDAALERLDALDELPVSEHVAQYDALHRTLQDALNTIDEG